MEMAKGAYRVLGMNPLQEKILEIFVEVKRICDKHSLRYYAIGGTCLGAVRHKGFIPWDDDLDIAMPDTDFERFMTIAQKELPEPFRLIRIGQLPHGNYLLIAKVQNANTTFIEPQEIPFKDSYKGVFVDIMPLGGVSGKKIERSIDLFLIKAVEHCNYYHRCRFEELSRPIGRAAYLAVNAVSFFLPIDFYSKIWRRLAFRRSFNEEQYTSFLWSGHPEKLVLERAWFDDYVEMPFENVSIRCPVGWDAYLKKHFGDYMRLPPQSKRIPDHGGGVVDIEKPYKYYQEKGIPGEW